MKLTKSLDINLKSIFLRIMFHEVEREVLAPSLI